MGIAAYTYGILSVKFGMHPIPASLFAIAASSLFGTAIGFITARTTGIFFIMASLAFGQMAYTLFFKATWLGGDDGMAGLARFDLSFIGINMFNSFVFVGYTLFSLLLVYIATALLLRSGFGQTLCGIHSNETRMKAVGIHTEIHKARGFGYSALLAGVAGILAAQHTLFISPELLTWTFSGEVLIVAILGGLGTLVGPLVGAVIFVAFKHGLSQITQYWHMAIGFILIATVLTGGRGIYGELEYRLKKHDFFDTTPLRTLFLKATSGRKFKKNARS